MSVFTSLTAAGGEVNRNPLSGRVRLGEPMYGLLLQRGRVRPQGDMRPWRNVRGWTASCEERVGSLRECREDYGRHRGLL